MYILYILNIYYIYNTAICLEYPVIKTIEIIYICTVRQSRHDNHQQSNVQLSILFFH